MSNDQFRFWNMGKASYGGREVKRDVGIRIGDEADIFGVIRRYVLISRTKFI
jgi:hypothetical protein